MRHTLHAIELDVHHNILPPVARDRVDAAVLLQAALPVAHADAEPWWVLGPEDQVLHCAAHLLNDSEKRDRLRDLVDLQVLMAAHGAAEPGFGARLVARARQLGLHDAPVLGAALVSEGLKAPLDPALQQVVQRAMAQRRLATLRRRFATVLAPRDPEAEPGAGRAPARHLAAGAPHLAQGLGAAPRRRDRSGHPRRLTAGQSCPIRAA